LRDVSNLIARNISLAREERSLIEVTDQYII